MEITGETVVDASGRASNDEDTSDVVGTSTTSMKSKSDSVKTKDILMGNTDRMIQKTETVPEGSTDSDESWSEAGDEPL